MRAEAEMDEKALVASINVYGILALMTFIKVIAWSPFEDPVLSGQLWVAVEAVVLTTSSA